MKITYQSQNKILEYQNITDVKNIFQKMFKCLNFLNFVNFSILLISDIFLHLYLFRILYKVWIKRLTILEEFFQSWNPKNVNPGFTKP